MHLRAADHRPAQRRRLYQEREREPVGPQGEAQHAGEPEEGAAGGGGEGEATDKGVVEEGGGGRGEAGGWRVEVDEELGVVEEAGAGGEGEELDELAEGGGAEVAAGDEAGEGAAEGCGGGAGSEVAEEVRRPAGIAGRRHGYDESGGKEEEETGGYPDYELYEPSSR